MTKNEDKKGGDKIKELALQIAAFTKEHERTDVLFACALMCTFILREVKEKDREAAFDRVAQFMVRMLWPLDNRPR
jgi:hypothetical protein